MLIMLTAFSMVTIAVVKNGMTVRPDGGNDSEWIKKGGDSTMSTALPLSGSSLLPASIGEETGLGGGVPAKEQLPEISRDQ